MEDTYDETVLESIAKYRSPTPAHFRLDGMVQDDEISSGRSPIIGSEDSWSSDDVVVPRNERILDTRKGDHTFISEEEHIKYPRDDYYYRMPHAPSPRFSRGTFKDVDDLFPDSFCETKCAPPMSSEEKSVFDTVRFLRDENAHEVIMENLVAACGDGNLRVASLWRLAYELRCRNEWKATDVNDWNEAFVAACIGNRVDVIEWILKIATSPRFQGTPLNWKMIEEKVSGKAVREVIDWLHILEDLEGSGKVIDFSDQSPAPPASQQYV